MKKYLILISAILIGTCVKAQETFPKVSFITLENGIVLSQFNFSDSEVTSFKNGSFSPSNYQALSLGFTLIGDLDFILGARYNKHEILGESIGTNNYHYSYDLSYASANLGLEYSLLLKNKLSLLLSGGVAYNYLIYGFQNIGASSYNLEDSNFDVDAFGYDLGLGLSYRVTDVSDIYFKYDWVNTLDMQESETEMYQLTSYVYSIGMRFSFASLVYILD